MAEVELECAVYGEGTVFPVKIASDAKVSALQEAIAGILSTEQHAVPPRLLTLYLARKNGEWLKDDHHVKTFLRAGISTEYEEMRPSWTLADEELFGEEFRPGRREIHVLVELPEAAVSVANLQLQFKEWNLNAFLDGGASKRWRDAYSASRIAHDALPSLDDLTKFIETVLPVRMGINSALYQYVKMRMSIQDDELLDSIFEIDDKTPCTELWYKVITPVFEASADGSTEFSYISFWDKIIRDSLKFVITTEVQTDRYSRKFASTGACRPHFLFKVDSVCVLRGEEESMGVDISVARRELTDKLVWTYGDVPYLFGYAAAGYNLSLYAIVCGIDGKSHTYPLGTYDLQNLNGRLELLRALLNIGRLFHSIAELCPDSGRGEYRRLVNRASGIEVYLEQTKVVKLFPNRDMLDHLTCIYKMLAASTVPNVDRVTKTYRDKNAIMFEPRGTERQPSSLDELFCVLRDVLAALVKLHAASWMHRDIRWPNVLKCRDNSDKWFLIDFCDAATSPQTAPNGRHLSKEGHAPEIHDAASHTSAVDIWSVGYLITSSIVYGSWQDSGPRDDFVRHLMHSNSAERMTAANALRELVRLEQEFKATKQEAAVTQRPRSRKRKKTT